VTQDDERERTLSVEEWNAYLSSPMSAEEEEEIAALFEWFTRRYPRAIDRLRYVHRVMKRPLSSPRRVRPAPP
jgi:hypothetical protein